MTSIKSPQDFCAGVLFVLVGLAGVYFGRDLTFGSARSMGPGYFPTIVSGLIVLLGLTVAGRSFRIDGPAIERLQLRPIAVLTFALAAFGFLIAKIGIILASILLIFLAAYARRDKVDIRETLIFAVGMSTFVVFVFVFGLGQTMPLWWGD